MATPILYDFARTARLDLNYKGIDYVTEFMEMPQVEPTLQKFGLEPNTGGIAYTLPTMRFPDGTYVMDSRKIADKIEEVWPDKPSLHLDSPIVDKVQGMEWELVEPLFGVIIPPIPRQILNEESIPYYRQKREPYFGDLDQLEKEKGGEQAWARAEEPWKKVAALLKENGGPFFLGKTGMDDELQSLRGGGRKMANPLTALVSHADFYILAFCLCMKQLGNDMLERLLAIDPALAELYRAGEPLYARDD